VEGTAINGKASGGGRAGILGTIWGKGLWRAFPDQPPQGKSGGGADGTSQLGRKAEPYRVQGAEEKKRFGPEGVIKIRSPWSMEGVFSIKSDNGRTGAWGKKSLGMSQLYYDGTQDIH